VFKIHIAYLIVGALIGSFIHARFIPDPRPQPSTPQIIEVIKYVKDTSSSKALKKSVAKEFNCNNGALSKETTTDVEIESSSVKETSDTNRKTEELIIDKKQLMLFAGLGAQLNIEKFSDFNLDKLKGQLAIGVEYDGYASFVASDFNKNHNGYIFKSWRFK